MMTEEAKLRGAIEHWTAKAIELAETRGRHVAERDRLATEREGLLVAALAEGDSDARRRVDALTAELEAATRAVADADHVAVQIDAKVRQLSAELTAARMRDNRARFNAAIAVATEAAHRVDQVLDGLDTAHVELRAALEACRQLEHAAHEIDERAGGAAHAITRELAAIVAEAGAWRAYTITRNPRLLAIVPHRRRHPSCERFVRALFSGGTATNVTAAAELAEEAPEAVA